MRLGHEEQALRGCIRCFASCLAVATERACPYLIRFTESYKLQRHMNAVSTYLRAWRTVDPILFRQAVCLQRRIHTCSIKRDRSNQLCNVGFHPRHMTCARRSIFDHLTRDVAHHTRK